MAVPFEVDESHHQTIVIFGAVIRIEMLVAQLLSVIRSTPWTSTIRARRVGRGPRVYRDNPSNIDIVNELIDARQYRRAGNRYQVDSNEENNTSMMVGMIHVNNHRRLRQQRLQQRLQQQQQQQQQEQQQQQQQNQEHGHNEQQEQDHGHNEQQEQEHGHNEQQEQEQEQGLPDLVTSAQPAAAQNDVAQNAAAQNAVVNGKSARSVTLQVELCPECYYDVTGRKLKVINVIKEEKSGHEILDDDVRRMIRNLQGAVPSRSSLHHVHRPVEQQAFKLNKKFMSVILPSINTSILTAALVIIGCKIFIKQ